MDHQTTHLSFWHVELSNLPVGPFRKRVLSNAEARNLISSARRFGKLVCVAKDDLGAPYGERERERHKQLCAALRDRAGVEIQLTDFFGSDSANPLCLVRVDERNSLLVVDCAYALDVEARADAARAVSGPSESSGARARHLHEDRLRMSIAPDTIEFYMFEQIEAAAAKSPINSSAACGHQPGG